MLKKLSLDNRAKFVFSTFLFSIGSVVNYLIKGGWLFASVMTVILAAVFVWYIWRHRDLLLAQMAVFTLCAGFIELLADCWGVDVGGLVYFSGGPFIMCSPLYMPFAWALTLLQIGFVGWWLGQKWNNLGWAMVVVTVIGALGIPTYEFLAKGSLLWYYQGVNMLFGIVPYYVMFAEALICLVLPPVLTWLLKKPFWWSVPLGIAEGFWMWLAGYIGYLIFR